VALKDQAGTVIVVTDDLIMAYNDGSGPNNITLIQGEILSEETAGGIHYLVIDKGAKARYTGDTAKAILTRAGSDYVTLNGIKGA
jgi:hypothetical protein